MGAWPNPHLQTNNLLSSLNGLNNPLASNVGALAGLGNINGLNLGLGMNLNQFGGPSNMPSGLPQMRPQN